jgi:Rieske Fe-S protein
MKSEEKREDEDLKLARRQILGVGVAGAALVVLPEACGNSNNPGTPDAATVDGQGAATSSALDSGEDVGTDAGVDSADSAADAVPEPPDATFVDGSDGGAIDGCAQTDYTHPVNILSAGIDSPGTSFEFTDLRYLDPACSQSQIILINPVTKTGYVALSGSCTHECCDNVGGGGPTYMPVCQLFADGATDLGLGCQAPPDAGSSLDASSDSSADAASDASSGLQPGQTLKDVLFCTCHGSIFNALNGEVIQGPAMSPLPQLQLCEGGGWVFVIIPPS